MIRVNIIRKCNHCKKWFAMKLQEKTVAQKDEINILERLFKFNLKGGVEPAIDHFAPGERLYYDIRYVCKYCGAEENDIYVKTLKK